MQSSSNAVAGSTGFSTNTAQTGPSLSAEPFNTLHPSVSHGDDDMAVDSREHPGSRDGQYNHTEYPPNIGDTSQGSEPSYYPEVTPHIQGTQQLASQGPVVNSALINRDHPMDGRLDHSQTAAHPDLGVPEDHSDNGSMHVDCDVFQGAGQPRQSVDERPCPSAHINLEDIAANQKTAHVERRDDGREGNIIVDINADEEEEEAEATAPGGDRGMGKTRSAKASSRQAKSNAEAQKSNSVKRPLSQWGDVGGEGDSQRQVGATGDNGHPSRHEIKKARAARQKTSGANATARDSNSVKRPSKRPRVEKSTDDDIVSSDSNSYDSDDVIVEHEVIDVDIYASLWEPTKLKEVSTFSLSFFALSPFGRSRKRIQISK